MPLLPVDAIIFDLDGTLVDERPSYREAMRRTAEFLLRAPVTPGEVAEIKSVPGLNNDWDATWALIGRRLHGQVLLPDEADRGSYAYRRLRRIFQTFYLGDALWHELSGEEPPFPWSDALIRRETPLIRLETLQRLARFKLGIATSRPRVEALMALRQHGLEAYFPPRSVVAAEDTPAQKPHPSPLREAARRLACRQAVYVGDTINDALAAARAGMPFIAIGSFPAGQVRHRVSEVNEVPALLAEGEL